jgi:hypothetical protein
MISEVGFIGIILYATHYTLFNIIFWYYCLVLILILIYQIKTTSLSFRQLTLAQNWLYNLKGLIYKSPTILRENIDVILVGIFFIEEYGEKYALVILCISPVRLAFSNIIIACNYYLAHTGTSYSSYDNKLKNGIIVLATVAGLLVAIITARYLFAITEFEIYVLITVKTLNISFNNIHNMNFLDNIQASKTQIDYRYVLQIISLSVIISIMLVNLFPSIYVLAICGFIFGTASHKIYKQPNN